MNKPVYDLSLCAFQIWLQVITYIPSSVNKETARAETSGRVCNDSSQGSKGFTVQNVCRKLLASHSKLKSGFRNRCFLKVKVYGVHLFVNWQRFLNSCLHVQEQWIDFDMVGVQTIYVC